MTAITHQQITLRGTLLAHKVFTADGWGKGNLEVPGEEFTVIVTGKLLNVRPGDQVEAIGFYVEDPRWGRQFKVSSCNPVLPDSATGIVRWMMSRLPDVGEMRAHQLVARFGKDLWRVVEHEPQKLCEVKGITPARAEAIKAAYMQVAHEREYMVKLRGWGLTDNQVGKCKAAWGDLGIVVERIREDPFQLASVVDGFGFKKADRVARAMGMRDDAPARIRAGILYMLDQGAQEGHCFLWGGMLRDMAMRMLGVNKDLVVKEILAVCEMQRIVRRGARVYSIRLERAEAACAVAVKRMLDRKVA